MDHPVIPATATEQTIAGTVIAGGVECPLLKLADGRVFALQGVRHRDVSAGQTLSVRGAPALKSYCQQGPAFAVRGIVAIR